MFYAFRKLNDGILLLLKRELAPANSLDFPILHPVFFNYLLITNVLHHFPMKNFKNPNAEFKTYS